MKRHLLNCLLLAPILLLLLTGCHKDSIVGKWQEAMPAGVTDNYEFTNDGKINIVMMAGNGPVPTDDAGKAGTLGSSGTYTVDSDRLTMTLTAGNFGGMENTAETTPPDTRTFVLNGDHLTLTNLKKTHDIVLTRMK